MDCFLLYRFAEHGAWELFAYLNIEEVPRNEISSFIHTIIRWLFSLLGVYFPEIAKAASAWNKLDVIECILFQ